MKNLGMKAEDKITGFKGIIIAKVDYLFGCSQYGIMAKVGKDGKSGECNYYDIGRVKITGKGVAPASVQLVQDPGGSSADAPTLSNGRRN
jgi:hypothetical protein